MSAFTPGLKLHDRYLLDRRIGTGGMAEVWRAHDLVLGRPVAVKVLAGPLATDPALRAGSLREARAAAQLTHPHITAVHDFGEVAFPDGHVEPYLVMELLTGESLADRIAYGPLPWAQVATIGGQVAGALAAAHARDVVHRDIKPGNIMLTPTGAKVLDFGIAAMTGLPDAAGGWIFGTPAYAAPERLRQAPADPAADVYALGVVLIEMVTGQQLYPAATWEQAATAHARPRPVPALPGVPAAAAALIRAAVEAAPAQRPRAADLAQALVGAPIPVSPGPAIAAPSPTLLAPVGGPISGAAKVIAPATQRYEAPAPTARPRRSGVPALAIALILAIVLIGGAMVFIALRPSPGGTIAAPTPTTQAPTPTASPTPKPEPSVTTAGLLAQLKRAVDDGVATGEIPDKRVQSLRKYLRDLTSRWERGKWDDIVGKAEDMRKDIESRVDDKEISEAYATRLYALLDQLIEQARQQDQRNGDG
jgi:serine/threonine-protein kinase